MPFFFLLEHGMVIYLLGSFCVYNGRMETGQLWKYLGMYESGSVGGDGDYGRGGEWRLMGSGSIRSVSIDSCRNMRFFFVCLF